VAHRGATPAGSRHRGSPIPGGRRVLLLTPAPQVYGAVVQSLESRGIGVHVAHSTRPLPVLDGLDLILVDVAHGPGLDRARVAALNRRGGGAAIVVLHEGSLAGAAFAEADLAVEGFCHADELHRLLPSLIRPTIRRKHTLH
jgi:hypothetical protein